MKMEFFASERNSDGDAEDSEHVGSWTPFDTIPSWHPELSAIPKYPLLTPLPDAPWNNNQPYYLTHFLNSLVGEAATFEAGPLYQLVLKLIIIFLGVHL